MQMGLTGSTASTIVQADPVLLHLLDAQGCPGTPRSGFVTFVSPLQNGTTNIPKKNKAAHPHTTLYSRRYFACTEVFSYSVSITENL